MVTVLSVLFGIAMVGLSLWGWWAFYKAPDTKLPTGTPDLSGFSDVAPTTRDEREDD